MKIIAKLIDINTVEFRRKFADARVFGIQREGEHQQAGANLGEGVFIRVNGRRLKQLHDLRRQRRLGAMAGRHFLHNMLQCTAYLCSIHIKGIENLRHVAGGIV